MGYKTFEDMKHNIPEGATHYQNETKEFSFAWFNVDKDKCYVDGEWWPYSLDSYPMDEIKPIPPTIKTESPEEREALDMIDTTSKQVESLAKGDVVEWKNGDECVINRKALSGEVLSDTGTYYAETDTHYWLHGIGCRDNKDVSGNIYSKKKYWLSKPESPEQKAERERLEAAYDLYLTAFGDCQNKIDSFNDMNEATQSAWLAVVDKTGYRKQ